MAHTITAQVGLSPSVTADLQGFSPSATEPAFTVAIPGHETFDPEVYGAQGGAVLCLARQAAFPGVKDYAGTLTDDELTDVDLSTTIAGTTALFRGQTVVTGQQDAALVSLDDDSFLVVAALDGTSVTAKDFLSYGGSLESEADNICYDIRLTDATQVEFICESGAGVNRIARWRIPDRNDGDQLVQYRFVRDAGELSCYYGSRQLKLVSATDGSTDNGDGTVSGMAATGGSSGELAFDDSPIRSYLLQVRTEVITDEAARVALVDWDASRYHPDGVAALETADTVGLFVAKSTGIVDESGGVAPGDWQVDGGEINVFDDVFLTDDAWTLSAAASAPFRLQEALTVDVSFWWGGATARGICGVTANGETEATNAQWMLYINSSSQIQYLAEYGAGNNAIVSFDLPSAMKQYTAHELRLVRTAAGVVSLTFDGEACTVTGTSNTTAPSTLPTGGGSTTLGIGNLGESGALTGASVRYLHIRNVAV